MKQSTIATMRFLAAVKSHEPRLYNAAIRAMSQNSGLSGLGETVDEMLARQAAFAETPWYQSMLNSLVDTVKQLAPAYMGVQQAKTCIDVNAARAKQGLDPIDCSRAGLSPQVNVGVSDDIKYMGFLALGILGVYLFTKGR